MLLAMSTQVGAQVAPDAPCPDARPMDSSCCTKTSTGPVLGGLDFVDLATKKPGVRDTPLFGSAAYTATLNNYTFHFLSADNAAVFKSSPWTFAPAWGGF